ncbi:MAG: GAF domain-containing protein [Clostridia bacterium]|nr:GAF domain-containing protein [Clostridia bacterium]
MTDYNLMIRQFRELAKDTSDPVSIMANTSALIFYSMSDLNWAGFYVVRGDELLVGPFQGKVACAVIKKGRGVCGTAWEKDELQLVPDVHAFPGHIACDCDSNSEIVVPIHHDSKVCAVLDIDSPVPGRFTEEDATGLSELVRALEEVL